jgi:2-polyprenyl-3-methyl-5-hydroxy-6-metoxy-1,4-benzoquinol methylase
LGNINPETGIWKIDLARRHKCDTLLAGIIGMMYSPNSTADLGCGNGMYCAIFKAIGWPTVHGYEGTPNMINLGIYDDIMPLNLIKRRVVGIKYDLVLCLEVGEHVPPQHEQAVLDNMVAFTTKDLIISWAVPGQYSASGHVNCQPNDYIVKQLEDREMKFDEKMTLTLRKHSAFNWFKKGVMAFQK